MDDQQKRQSRGWIGWVLVVILLAVGITAWGVGRILNARQHAQARIGEIDAQIKVLAKEHNALTFTTDLCGITRRNPKDPVKRREIANRANQLIRQRQELRKELERSASSSLFRRFGDLFP
jgi:hypothetical protein